MKILVYGLLFLVASATMAWGCYRFATEPAEQYPYITLMMLVWVVPLYASVTELWTEWRR